MSSYKSAVNYKYEEAKGDMDEIIVLAKQRLGMNMKKKR
jgi:hypothetical protein